VDVRVLIPFWAAIVAVPFTGEQTPSRTPDIYFAPTPHVLADAMLTLAKVTPDDLVYDLGSGDGRIVVLAAQKYHALDDDSDTSPEIVGRILAFLRFHLLALDGTIQQAREVLPTA
jgi:hypothetical protein